MVYNIFLTALLVIFIICQIINYVRILLIVPEGVIVTKVKGFSSTFPTLNILNTEERFTHMFTIRLCLLFIINVTVGQNFLTNSIRH